MNEHVFDYCKKFIENKEDPKFAIFINGPWGVGKTFFIENLFDEYPSKKDEKDEKESNQIYRDQLLKISLFGVSTTEEIDNLIYQASHPWLSSKGAQLTGVLLKTALRIGTNQDIIQNFLKGTEIPMDDIFPKKIAGNLSRPKRLIVVDDFERANLTPNQIFGYFSNFITESNIRIIFIGNEENLPHINDKEMEKVYVVNLLSAPTQHDYFLIKEKTIGIEFKLEPDFDNAISCFISEIGLANYTDLLAELLPNIITGLKCQNLRLIRQCLYNLKVFLDCFNGEIDEEDIKEIVSNFIVLYMQKNLNTISKEDDINDILYVFNSNKQPYKEFKDSLAEATKGKSLTNKVFSFTYKNKVPLLNEWKNIIFEGKYNSNYLLEKYQREKQERLDEIKKDQINSLFMLIKNWRDFDSNQFQSQINLVKNDFVSGQFLHPGLVLHYANIMFVFSEWNLIPDTKELLMNEINQFLDKYGNKIESIDDWSLIETGYGGYAYSFDIEEVQDVNHMLEVNNEKNLKKYLQKKISEDLLDLENTFDEFIKKIRRTNGMYEYRPFSILSMFPVENLYNSLKSISVKQQIIFADCLKDRYGMINGSVSIIPDYIDDIEPLKKLRDLYTEDTKDFLYNPQKMLLNSVAIKFSEIVDFFNEEMEEKTENMIVN